MHLVGHLLAAGSMIAAPAILLGDISSPRRDVGVVCLDRRTGTPLWEDFSSSLAGWTLATDGGTLFLVGGQFHAYRQSPSPATRSALRVDALPLDPHLEGPLPGLPGPGHLNWAQPAPRPRITKSGDRVVGELGSDRAITIMKGCSDEPHVIIPVGDYFERILVQDDLVIYALSAVKTPKPAAQKVVAVDANTGQTAWAIDDVERVLGLGHGKERVYICEPAAMRALDPKSGTELWRRELPRIQDYAWIVEDEGDVFVWCDYLPTDARARFLYCLDIATAEVRWIFEPDGSPFWPLLLPYGDRVYTQIGPSRLLSKWKTYGDGEVDLGLMLGGKSRKEVDLNLRAWHTLGDRSAMVVLSKAASVAHYAESRELARELLGTFPVVRDPAALVRFLNEEFDRDPALRSEISRIVRDFDPVPYWYDKELVGFPPEPLPKFELSAEQTTLIDAYVALRRRTDVPSVTPLDWQTVSELIFAGKRGFTFDALVAAHDASRNEEYRRQMRRAMFSQHPAAASDWALTHIDDLNREDVTCWARLAPFEWLLIHGDLFYGWLRSEDRGLRYAATGRLESSRHPDWVVPICVRLLQEETTGEWSPDNRVVGTAIRLLAKYGTAEHIPLLQSYAEGGNINTDTEINHLPTQKDREHHALRQQATYALRALGADVSDVPRLPDEVRFIDENDPNLDVRRRTKKLAYVLHKARYKGDREASQTAARRILDLSEGGSSTIFMGARTLADAYEALGEWDKAIEYRRAECGNDRHCRDSEVLPLLAKADRIDEIETLLDEITYERDLAIGATLLIDAERLGKAFAVFSNMLKKNPNSCDACSGLAKIYFKRGDLHAADAMMERAIALRPSPLFTESFEYTVTYWLERRQPARARAWVRESARIDPDDWQRRGLLNWAAQFPELKDVIELVRRRNDSGRATLRD